jgi:16S rRNA (cytidine1402-2'-O)-methyltransferase
LGTLYVVATPIGNLEDVTLRAIRVFGEVDVIAAEDTRTVRKLLSHHNIAAPRLVAYTDENRKSRIPSLLRALEAGDVALVSEAGTPGISDPGVHLVEAAAAAGHAVVPVPGASALATALAASGLPLRRVHFLGFLPRRSGERLRLLADVASLPATLVLFEAPHRLRASLRDLHATLGDRRVAVCRELTKVHEEVFRGTLAGAIEHFASPRGEFTLVIEGVPAVATRDVEIDIDRELLRLRSEGLYARDAVRQVAERSGLNRRAVYERWLALAKR